MDGQRKKTYFGLQKVRYCKCLEPSEQCECEPVRSHSIQNSRILESLCSNGHLIMPTLAHTKDGVPEPVFARVGRNKATTFAGLCARHDQEIFRPIECAAIDAGNPHHLFLLAYRAVLRETHACIEGAVRMQLGYQDRVAAGRSPTDRPDDAGMMAAAWLGNSYDTYEYKKKFDEAYLKADHDRLCHYSLVFENVLPSIGVNGLFSLDDIEWPADVARIAVNIFPEQGQTCVIFSFLKEEKPFAMAYLQRILDATGTFQQYLVSKLVLQHCENFAIAPSYFEQMSEAKKAAILDFFRRTLAKNEHDYENKDLFLF